LKLIYVVTYNSHSDVLDDTYLFFREAVLHKDIASRNIVLDDNYNARLIDFGLARETSDTTSKASGRDFYAHPEIGKGFHAKEAWDYFAFGVSK
jgi:serine/threonine protein kinase